MIDASLILSAKILIVDDLAINIHLLDRILSSAGYTSIAATTNPAEVCELHRTHRYDVIFLDLMMPQMDGFSVLERLKEIEPEGYVPVLVVTAHPLHKLRALQAGARDFISSPFEQAEVLARVRNILEIRLLNKQLETSNEILEHQVKQRTSELHDSHLETIFVMTRTAEHRDEKTGAHVHRISYYSRLLANLLGQDEKFVDEIYFASPMHDVGKVGIPDQILLKPASLTPSELEIMRGHALLGAEIIGDSNSPYLRMGADIALNHHERWDGSGYPNGKRGAAIPLAARITNICDIYDALRSERPYKPAFDHAKTMDIITHGDGRTEPAHFDPAILATFAKHHEAFRDIFEANKA